MAKPLHTHPEPSQRRAKPNRKLHRRYTGLVFSFYMSAIMAALMCTFVTAINTGFAGDFLWRVAHAYLLAMPVAFVCVLSVRPLVLLLVSKTVNSQ